MFKDKSDNVYNSLRSHALSLFNEDHNKIKLKVSPAEQQKEIDLLKQTLGSERFFFVVDLLNFEISEVHGIQRWLGYSEKQFSLKQYIDEVVDSSHRLPLLLVATHVLEIYCRGVYPLKFMVQRFGSFIPIRDYKGGCRLAKKTSVVFQYDEKNRMTAYLNEFTLVGNYHGEALSPTLYTAYGEKLTDAENEVIQKVCSAFEKMKIFAATDLQIARIVAYNPHITQLQIANKLKLSKNTIQTHYNRFLTRARTIFNEDFPTVLAAATRLKNDALL